MKKVYLLAVCALALFSCQKEQNVPEEDGLVPKGYTKLTLNAVSDVTKTTVEIDGNEGTVKWKTGDEIKVYCSDGSASDFTLVGEGGSTTGSFAGLVPSGKTAVYAVYPNDRYSSVDGTTVNVTIPDEQEGTFGNANIAVAKIDAETHNMAFKNVNAFVGFTVSSGITKVVISSVNTDVNTEKNLYGTLAVDCLGDPTAGALSGGGSSITVTFPEEKVSTGGTYYVAIAPGIRHEKGLLLEWYKGSKVSGTYWLNKDITTVANNVYDMGEVSTSGDYYVTVDGGTSVKNGMSWATAWSASQFWSKIHLTGSDTDKHNAKLANINGATFHLAAGTYKWGPDAAINIDETETISFTIKGESGTIFTGDDDADGTGDHRILSLGGNMDVTFDGVCFEKGFIETTTDDSNGAGVLITGGTWEFKDCSFSSNIVLSDGINRSADTGGYGGAIAITSGNLTINGGTFSGNMAWKGGAIWQKSWGTVTITGASFTGNGSKTTTRGGGAVYVERSTTFNDCTMTGNKANYGGALDIESENTVCNINGGTYSNNESADVGGAIDVGEKTIILIDKYGDASTSFEGNSAGTEGGAIFIETQKSGAKNLINRVKSASFSHNSATTRGGAFSVVTSNKIDTLQIAASTFTGNTAVNGGAIYWGSRGCLELTSESSQGCTFSNNHCTEKGGAIRIEPQSVTVTEGVSNLIVKMYRARFIGNYAATGGAFYSCSGEQKADIFMDRCSFEDNHMTDKYGVFTSDGANHLCMNNCTFKGNYTSGTGDSQKNLLPSWICIDGMTSSNVFSMSNCSIIGDVQYSADGNSFTSLKNGTALVALWGNNKQTNYFTNNIIVPEDSDIKAISGNSGTVKIDLFYNQTGAIGSGNKVVENGNVYTRSKSSLNAINWYVTSSGNFWYWSWVGTFTDTPSASFTNYKDVKDRLTEISSRFVNDYLKSDIKSNCHGGNRPDDPWWPGAYQK